MITKTIEPSIIYIPSGRFSGLTYIILAFSLVLILPALSIVYSFITWYSPIVYLNLIVTIFTGAILGAATYPLVKYGKIRSYQHEILFLIVTWFFFLWSGWAVHLTMVNNISETGGTSFNLSIYLFYLAHPLSMLQDIKILATMGLFEIMGVPINGLLAYFVWLLEAAILLIAGFKFNKKWSVMPFSELDNLWGKKQKLKTKLALHRGVGKFADALKSQDITVFNNAPTTTEQNMEYTDMVLFTFPRDEASYLAFYNKTVETDNKGKKKQHYERNSDFYYVAPGMKQALIHLFALE